MNNKYNNSNHLLIIDEYITLYQINKIPKDKMTLHKLHGLSKHNTYDLIPKDSYVIPYPKVYIKLKYLINKSNTNIIEYNLN